MCGITGVLLQPKDRSNADWNEILRIHRANFLFNERRGRKASGMAVIQNDGRCEVFKEPVKASQLLSMPGHQQALSIINQGTVCILGHTRRPTKGSFWNNLNNHPIQAGRVVGIHNGMITNDDDLFALHNIQRLGEVDSEIIFQLQNKLPTEVSTWDYLEKNRQIAGMLEGSFATLSMDLRRPGELLVMKQNRPLCLHYEKRWAALFFSSRYIFLRKAFGRQVINESLQDGYGYLFNSNQLSRYGSQPVQRFCITEDRKDGLIGEKNNDR